MYITNKSLSGNSNLTGVEQGVKNVLESKTEADAAKIREISHSDSPIALEIAVKKLNEAVKGRGIKFSIDEESGRVLVQVINMENNEVIRQFPSKEAIEISNHLTRLQGILINKQA